MTVTWIGSKEEMRWLENYLLFLSYNDYIQQTTGSLRVRLDSCEVSFSVDISLARLLSLFAELSLELRVLRQLKGEGRAWMSFTKVYKWCWRDSRGCSLMWPAWWLFSSDRFGKVGCRGGVRKKNPSTPAGELPSEKRCTSAKKEPNEVADMLRWAVIDQEINEGANANERAPLLVLVGGGGHTKVKVVSCFVRLGVLNMIVVYRLVFTGTGQEYK